MSDEQFDALCEANSFGAVARGDFQLVPRALLKALVDAAVAAEREACAYRAGIALLGADRGLSNRVDQAIRARGQA
jgi:hypothetical protein